MCIISFWMVGRICTHTWHFLWDPGWSCPVQSLGKQWHEDDQKSPPQAECQLPANGHMHSVGLCTVQATQIKSPLPHGELDQIQWKFPWIKVLMYWLNWINSCITHTCISRRITPLSRSISASPRVEFWIISARISTAKVKTKPCRFFYFLFFGFSTCM